MTNEQIEQAVKSLKWVVNQIPDNLSDSNEDKMLKCIRLYCENGAEAISCLREKLKDGQLVEKSKPKCQCDKHCADCNADAHIDGGCKNCPLYK